MKYHWRKTGFIFLCLLQLFFAARLIYQHENVIRTGELFKFRAAPVDPYDPFRGKYLTLNFAQQEIQVTRVSDFHGKEIVYGIIEKDSAGYATISALSLEKPADDVTWLEIQPTGFQDIPGEQKVYFQLPFNRLYLEESLAPEAEKRYIEALQSGEKETYALVYVHMGRGVLDDVEIDGISVKKGK